MTKVVVSLFLAVLGTAMGQEAVSGTPDFPSVFALRRRNLQLRGAYPEQPIPSDLVDGTIIVDQTTITGQELPLLDRTDEKTTAATTLAYDFCETIPAGATITCQMSSCTLPSFNINGLQIAILEIDTTGTPSSSTNFTSCPASVSRTFTAASKGVLIAAYGFSTPQSNPTATGVSLSCTSSDFTPTITDEANCEDPLAGITGNPTSAPTGVPTAPSTPTPTRPTSRPTTSSAGSTPAPTTSSAGSTPAPSAACNSSCWQRIASFLGSTGRYFGLFE